MALQSPRSTLRHLRLEIKTMPFLRIVPGDSGDKLNIFCEHCARSFLCSRTNHIKDHIGGEKHRKSVELRQPRQQQLVLSSNSKTRMEDGFNKNLADVWISAGLPLNAFANEKLKTFLERGFSRPLPNVRTLWDNYSESAYAEKLDKLKAIVKETNFFIIFDECDNNGDKYYAVLVGVLDNQGTNPAHLVTVTKESECPNAIMVQQKLMHAFEILGITSHFNNFRLFLSDAASYNILAGKNLQTIYAQMIHVTCFSHLLARVCSSIVDSEFEVNQLVSCVKKVFNKCNSRVSAWKNFNSTQSREPFPKPIVTRWGSWLKAVIYLCKHWTDLKDFLETVPESKSRAASLAKTIMETDGMAASVGFISALEFLPNYITLSESRTFTAVQAGKALDEITQKLIDLQFTGNKIAERAIEKIQSVVEKNQGLQRVAALARGEGVVDPTDIGVYAFAPCTSCDVERFFSILNAFIQDKPNLLETTLNKLLFIRYNQYL